jgi:diguanylate cyclase (GGDEF)-like protein
MGTVIGEGGLRATSLRWRLGAAAVLVVLVILLVLPVGSMGRLVFARGAGVVATIVFLAAVLRFSGPVRWMWLCFWGFQALTVVADIIFDAQTNSVGEPNFPGPSDVLYLASSVVAFIGLIVLGRLLRPGGDLDAWIDAALVTVAVGSVVGAFIVGPILIDSSGVDLAVVVSLAYPVLDMFVLAALLRMLIVQHTWDLALSLLPMAMVLFVAYDLLFNYETIAGNWSEEPIMEVIWTAAILLMTLAVTAPGAGAFSSLSAGEQITATPTRSVAMSVGVLAAPTLVVVELGWGTTSIATWLAVMAVVGISLLLWRTYRLLRAVQGQARRLGRQARSDALTGLPNRRSWGYEINRLADRTREEGLSLSVAILDIDHFKEFNDTRGHQAGDALLAEAARRWRAHMVEGGFIARYGGEEFGVLLPGTTLLEAIAILDEVRRSTPEGETISVGVTQLRRDESPRDAVRRADRALYRAKAAGRDRVVADDDLVAALPQSDIEVAG